MHSCILLQIDNLFVLSTCFLYQHFLLRPIYSGHFHKPHLVQAPKAAPGVSVHYVGSPFEISLAEAGQRKALLVLDSSQNWKVVDTIPLDGIGPQHYRFTSMTEFLNHEFFTLLTENTATTASETHYDSPLPQHQQQQQQRIVVSVSQQELVDMRNSCNTEINGGAKSLCPFDAKVKLLRKMGAKVEVREEAVTQNASNYKEDNTTSSITIEDMTPTDVMSLYFTDQVKADRMSNQTATRLLEAGTSLLESDLLNSESSTSLLMNNIMNPSSLVREIDFHSVTIEGYGSFKDEVTYPLMDRGLVLIRGSNLDGGYDR
jgi:hypothetical protein